MPKFHLVSRHGDNQCRITINPFNDREAAENHLQQCVAQHTGLNLTIEEITDHTHLVDLLIRFSGCRRTCEGETVIRQLASRLTTHSLEEVYAKLTASP